MGESDARRPNLADALRLGPASGAGESRPDVTFDSRKVAPGMIFVAVMGERADGVDFVPAAVSSGALAVLTDLRGAYLIRERFSDWPLPVYVTPEPRRLAAHLARAAWPEQPQTVVAATGTNGKTSVASFAAQIFAALGHRSATFGTAGMASWNLAEPMTASVNLTTPEPTALHQLLAQLAQAQATHVAMEASSHGLLQHRPDGVDIHAAAFTNLTRDHLDYHGDMGRYAAAKLRLFSEVVRSDAVAVLNADDPIYPVVDATAAARGLARLPVGRAAVGERAVTVLEERPHALGLHLRFRHLGVEHETDLGLIGAFQGANALSAAGLALAVGEAPEDVFGALSGLRGVRGRMELAARRGNGAGVFVDYAHTSDALAVALAALRPHVDGRLHVVFGAGGDRDAGKRPLMGAAAAAGADRVIVTDDNPRSEDPAAIREVILAAAPEATEVGDRAEAILRGVDGLEPGDALLIAGKGHEQGQIVGRDVLPFDDVEQARAAVIALDGADGEIIGA